MWTKVSNYCFLGRYFVDSGIQLYILIMVTTNSSGPLLSLTSFSNKVSPHRFHHFRKTYTHTHTHTHSLALSHSLSFPLSHTYKHSHETPILLFIFLSYPEQQPPTITSTAKFNFSASVVLVFSDMASYRQRRFRRYRSAASYCVIDNAM